MAETKDPVQMLRDHLRPPRMLTQKELAELIHVSPQYLNDVLNGRRDPGPSILDWLGLDRAYVQKEADR